MLFRAGWSSEQLAKPLFSWLQGFLEAFAHDADLLQDVAKAMEVEKDDARRQLLEQSAVARYGAHLAVVKGLGPRLTPCAALLGLSFQRAKGLEEKVWDRRREEPAALEASVRREGLHDSIYMLRNAYIRLYKRL